MRITTIGLDLAKSVFQAHGADETGATVLTKRLHRKQMLPFFSKLSPCLIGVEACATAHHWARTLAAMGHEVRLMPPSYVKGYVKRGKSDALDAEAICEAVGRPTMRFVPVKTVEQQGILMAQTRCGRIWPSSGWSRTPASPTLPSLPSRRWPTRRRCRPMPALRCRSWCARSWR